MKLAPLRPRKVVQISTATAGDGSGEVIFALCDDGTMWERAYVASEDDFTWFKIETPPETTNKGPNMKIAAQIKEFVTAKNALSLSCMDDSDLYDWLDAKAGGELDHVQMGIALDVARREIGKHLKTQAA